MTYVPNRALVARACRRGNRADTIETNAEARPHRITATQNYPDMYFLLDPATVTFPTPRWPAVHEAIDVQAARLEQEIRAAIAATTRVNTPTADTIAAAREARASQLRDEAREDAWLDREENCND